MGFRYCNFEERIRIKEADARLLEPLRRLVEIAEDRLDRAENIDEFGRKILYLEIKNDNKHRLYALFDVPAYGTEYGLFVYRIECGEHELPLGLSDCMLLPKNPESVNIEICYHLRGVLPETVLEVIKDLETCIPIQEAKWNAVQNLAQRLVREGFIKF